MAEKILDVAVIASVVFLTIKVDILIIRDVMDYLINIVETL